MAGRFGAEDPCCFCGGCCTCCGGGIPPATEGAPRPGRSIDSAFGMGPGHALAPKGRAAHLGRFDTSPDHWDLAASAMKHQGSRGHLGRPCVWHDLAGWAPHHALRGRPCCGGRPCGGGGPAAGAGPAAAVSRAGLVPATEGACRPGKRRARSPVTNTFERLRRECKSIIRYPRSCGKKKESAYFCVHNCTRRELEIDSCHNLGILSDPGTVY